MNLDYRFYRDSLIKVAILSVGCLGIFWDWFHGRSKDEAGAVLLIAVLMVVSNVGLFLAMRRAKRREEAGKSEISSELSGNASRDSNGRVMPKTVITEPFEGAVRKRRRARAFMSFWAIGGGLLFWVFGHSFLVDGIPVPWIGYVLIVVGVLGLLGVNVFYGGPLDLRRDRRG